MEVEINMLPASIKPLLRSPSSPIPSGEAAEPASRHGAGVLIQTGCSPPTMPCCVVSRSSCLRISAINSSLMTSS